MATMAGATFLLTTRGLREPPRALPRVLDFIAATTLWLFVTLPAREALSGLARLGIGWSVWVWDRVPRRSNLCATVVFPRGAG